MARAPRDARTRALLLVVLVLLLCTLTLHQVGLGDHTMPMAFGTCLVVLALSGVLLLVRRIGSAIPLISRPVVVAPAQPVASLVLVQRSPPGA